MASLDRSPLAVLSSSERTSVPEYINRALRHLRDCREPSKGWGAYRGTATDIHNTALAAEALHLSGDEKHSGLVADAAVYLRSTYRNSLDSLSLDDLVDLLRLVDFERQDEEYTRKLYEVVDTRLRDLKRGERVSVRTLSRALLATAAVPASAGLSSIPGAIELLISLQQEDGCWPSVRGEYPSIIATAMAVRALGRWSDEKSAEKRSCGVNYLKACLDKNGWRQLDSISGMFAVSLVLSALSHCDYIDYQTIESGVETISASQNKDGGWGSGIGQPSGVEHTAVCVCALIESGENKVIPIRLAANILSQSSGNLQRLQSELDNLRGELASKVSAECGQVVRERDQLRAEVSDLKKNARILDGRIRILEGEKYLESVENREVESETLFTLRASGFRRLQVLGLLGVLAIVSATLFFFEDPFALMQGIPNWLAIPISLAFSVMVFMLYYRYLVRWINRNTIRSGLLDRRLRNMVTPDVLELTHVLKQASTKWPPLVREEFKYRLFRELPDMPASVAHRYSADLAERLDLPASERRLFRAWVDEISRLSSSERRLLLERFLE